MKKLKFISVLLAGIMLFTSCSTTMYFQRTSTDQETGNLTLSEDIIEAPPVGLLTPGQRDPRLDYKMKWGNLVLGVVLLQTVVVPLVMWGFFLFEADHMKDGGNYIKTEEPVYTH